MLFLFQLMLAWEEFYSTEHPYHYLGWIMNYALGGTCFHTGQLPLPPAYYFFNLTLANLSID